MKVELAEQVLTFVRSQPPEPRRKLRLGLRKLAEEQGDIRSLEGPLRGYFRLRIGPYRIITGKALNRGREFTIQCVFAERRDVVYAVFSRVLQNNILGRMKDLE